MRVILTLITFAFLGTITAQLVTNGGQSAESLVQNVLLGSGVEVSNVNFSGSMQAIGTFNATNTSIGIDEGILITTGTINSGPQGPYGPNDKPDAGIDNGVGGYVQLSNLVGGTATFNAAILEFDFIPYSDTVKFRYVFASEEYPEYVGSTFNDVFAFFISGPGIPGGSKNMAIIPGTNNPVTINNVNAQSNQMYFQSNGTGSEAPYNTNPYYVQYDGFTVPLEAVSEVECGETYHLVIALADVADAIFDSGIFLEKNSLSSEQPVEVDYLLTSDPYGDGVTMAQNCTSAIITITRSGNKINQPLTVPIHVSGDAVQGLDYTSIPTSVTFQPGQTILTFTIDALVNPNLTGTASLFLEFEIEDACGGDNSQTVQLYIQPVEPVDVQITSTDVLCPGDNVVLNAIPFGGGGEYSYTWSTGETTPTISVSPSSTQTYTVSVSDECLNQTATASVEVEIPVFEPLVVEPIDDVFEDCPFMPTEFFANVSGGSGSYIYSWTNDGGRNVGSHESIEVAPASTTTYYLVVTDFCGTQDSISFTMHILSPPLIVTISPSQQVCPGETANLEASATGGFGDYYFFWPHSGETSSTVIVNPNTTTEYMVIVKDDCQTFQVQASTTVEVIQPDADFQPVTDPLMVGLPVTFQNLTENGSYYDWDFGDGNMSTSIHPNNTYYESGTYYITLIAEDNHGCLDTITKPITILDEVYLYVPNSFTPDNDRYNNTFEVSAIGIVDYIMKIYNRWGELLFETYNVNEGWDGFYNNQFVPDGTYVWEITYTTRNSDVPQVSMGHVNVLR